MKYVLAHDLGTSGDKATLFSESGQIIKSCVKHYPCKNYNGNWAEQNADDYWNAVCETTKIILESVCADDIAGVSFSGQMMGCICVDKNKNAIHPAIIWADQRAAKQALDIKKEISDEAFFKITGHRNSPSYSIQKFMWIKENLPQIYKQTYKILNCKDYIILKLTGEFATEYTDAAGTNAFDISQLEWSKDILSVCKIDADKLPKLLSSTDIVGYVTKEASNMCGLAVGTPVVMGGGDGCCAAVGAASMGEGEAYCCLGTSAWISYTASKPVFDDNMLVFNFPSMKKGYFHPCGTMQAAGVSVNWMLENIADYNSESGFADKFEYVSHMMNSSVPGSGGVMYLPYLMGERSPRWNDNAKGVFLGLKAENSRADIIRSVFEGVTFNLAVILNIFKKYNQFKDMKVIGGGSKNESWLQIISDCFGLGIVKPNYVEEATSMGAALAAGIGVGMFKDFSEINKFIKEDKRFIPNLKNNALYNERIEIFNEAYTALKETFNRL